MKRILVIASFAFAMIATSCGNQNGSEDNTNSPNLNDSATIQDNNSNNGNGSGMTDTSLHPNTMDTANTDSTY